MNITKKEFNFFWNNCNQLLKGYLDPKEEDSTDVEEENKYLVNGKYSIFNNVCIMNNDFSFLKFKLKSDIPWCVTLDGIDFFKKFKDIKKNYNDGSVDNRGLTFSLMDELTNAPKSYHFDFNERDFNSWKVSYNKLVVETFLGKNKNVESIGIDLNEEQVTFLSKAKVFVLRIDKNKKVSFDLSYDSTKKKYLMQNRFTKNILMKINPEDKVAVQLNIVKDPKMSNFMRFAFHVDTKHYEFWQYFKIVNIE